MAFRPTDRMTLADFTGDGLDDLTFKVPAAPCCIGLVPDFAPSRSKGVSLKASWR